MAPALAVLLAGGGRAASVVRHGELLFPEDGGEGDDDGSRSGPRAAAAAGAACSSAPRPSARPRPPSPQTWLVLELCDLGSLQEALDAGLLRTSRDPREGVPHLPAILATAREIASAMAYVHAEGVVHGDLSAWNVLLARSGGPGLGGRGWLAKVGDFGLARHFSVGGKGAAAAAAAEEGGRGAGGGGDSSNNNSGSNNTNENNIGPVPAAALLTGTHGTVTHCAPELLARGELSPAADVYAFGVCLWQMWTGARPWHGLTHAQIVRAVTAEGRALAWPANAPEGLVALGEACLSRDPADRPTFADVVDVLAPLAEVLEGAAEMSAAHREGGAARAMDH